MIKIRCIEESGIVSDLIDFRELGTFSHVEFILPEGYLGSRLNGGVQIRPFDYCTPVREAILSIVLDPEDEARVLSWAKAQIGDSYGWRDVVDVAVNEEVLAPKGMDCSHFVAKALDQGGFRVTRKPFPEITPGDHFNTVRYTLVSDTQK